MAFYTHIYGAAGWESVDRACEQVGLSAEHRSTRTDSLPTGIRRCAALAAAIEHEPELLFLDEPTSGVDPCSRKVFWDLIKGLAARGTTVLVTTHAMFRRSPRARTTRHDPCPGRRCGCNINFATARSSSAYASPGFLD